MKTKPVRLKRPQPVYGRCSVCERLVLVNVLAPGLTTAQQHPPPKIATVRAEDGSILDEGDLLGCRGSGTTALPRNKENP